MNARAPHVLIIGGGLGGLCLAQGLRGAGVSLAVYERDTSPVARGQGYRFHLNEHGERALRQCLPPRLFELAMATRGQESTGGTIFSAMDGKLREVNRFRFAERGSGELVTVGSAVDRLTLRQILLAELEDVVLFGKAFTHYEQQPGGAVRAVFADGTQAVGDVLVAADGASSWVRRQFLPHGEPLDSGIRWLGGKTDLTEELRAALPIQVEDSFGFVPGPGVTVLFGLFLFREDPRQAAARLAPELHFHDPVDYAFWGVLIHKDGLRISDDELTALPGPSLRDLTRSLVTDETENLRALVEQCQPEHTFVLRMRNAPEIDPWPTTNVTLLGDAIHVMPPRGSGANTALRDASLLTRHLGAVANQGTPLQQALHEYEGEMLPYGLAAVRASTAGGTLGGLL